MIPKNAVREQKQRDADQPRDLRETIQQAEDDATREALEQTVNDVYGDRQRGRQPPRSVLNEVVTADSQPTGRNKHMTATHNHERDLLTAAFAEGG